MRRRIGRVLAPRCASVTIAVVLVAHKRAALLHFVFALFGSLRILMDDEGVVTDGPPVRGPFPNVTNHVVQSETVRREVGDRIGSGKTVLS